MYESLLYLSTIRNAQNKATMTSTRLSTGFYRIEGIGETFCIRNTGTCWVAYDATSAEGCTNETNWGQRFCTKKELIEYAKG